MHRRALALIAGPLLAAAVPAHAARVEIILDVSGSMRASLGPETRMDAARKAIRATVAGVQPDSVVALRLYGHRVSQDDKAGSCRDTELVVPFEPINKERVIGIVDRATPRGQTPLTYSLQQAVQDFGPASDEERVIIVVTDGEESCGGDPTAAARALQAQGFKLKVHTIGFDVDAAARAQLEALSQATGGEYHDARNAAALADSLTRLAQKSLLVEKADESLGQPIRGGDGYESAVRLQPGQLHRLDHHQREGEYDYFYVEVREGQRATASIETTPRGVRISGTRFHETDDPYAGLILQDSSRDKLAERTVGGRAAREEVAAYVPESRGGRLYVLVGNTITDQHKDSRFRLVLTDRPGDAGSSTDAGPTEAGALALSPGSHTGRLDRSDRVDFYRFPADPQASYRVRLRHAHNNTLLMLSVITADGDVVKKDLAREDQALTFDGITIPSGGEGFVRVTYHLHQGADETPYTLELAQAGGTPAAASSTDAKAPGAPGAATGGPSLIARFVSFVLWSGVPLVLGLVVGGVAGFLFGRRRR